MRFGWKYGIDICINVFKYGSTQICPLHIGSAQIGSGQIRIA